MPKIIGTRKQLAKELLERVKNGPAMWDEVKFEAGCGRFATSPKAAYDLWASSWVIPSLKRLIPELKEPKP